MGTPPWILTVISHTVQRYGVSLNISNNHPYLCGVLPQNGTSVTFAHSD